MLTCHVFLVPPLPTLLVDEHRGHRTEMLEACARAAAALAAAPPDAVVAMSARWTSDRSFLVDTSRRHTTLTDYPGLGVEVRYDCAGHPALARALVAAGEQGGVRVGPATRGVDSGVSVPLHFLVPSAGIPVVPLSVGAQSAAECRRWGAVARATIEARRERVAVVVGGFLAADFHAWELKRDVPESRRYDAGVLDALARGAWDELAGLDPALAARAHPDVALRHLEFLRGFLTADVAGEVLCYERAPGIGAALVAFPLTPDAGSIGRPDLSAIERQRVELDRSRRRIAGGSRAATTQRPRGGGPRGTGPRGVGPRPTGPRGPNPRGPAAPGPKPRGTGPRPTGPGGPKPRGTGPRPTGPRGPNPRGTGPRPTGPRGTGPRPTGPRGLNPRGPNPRGPNPRGTGPRGRPARKSPEAR